MLVRLVAPGLLLMTACQDGAGARCFAPEATLPERAATIRDTRLGGSARDLIEALFDGDAARAGRLLAADPALAKSRVGERHSMLTVAMAGCSAEAVTLLIRHGAPLDPTGDGGTLQLALMADDPVFAHALLAAGADPTPAASPLGPFRAAISTGSRGGVRLLLDSRANPNVRDRVGGSPLQTALDQERFAIAELLLDRGADPWAVDSGGGNLATSVGTPMVASNPDDAGAQRRLAARLARLGWPRPAPRPADIRRLALAGQWPPSHAKAPPVPPAVLAIMAENARREQGGASH